ncbi:hypothetical protein [Clostridium sp. Marseille-Q7071]
MKTLKYVTKKKQDVAKAGFKGDVNYDTKKGFSISQDYMKNNGLNHFDITTKQR